MAKKTNKEFVQQVYDLAGDEYTFLEEYVNSQTKIEVVHNCNKCLNFKYKIIPNNFLRGSRCPACFGTKKRTQEEFEKEIETLTNGEYLVKGVYLNARTKIEIEHTLCGFIHSFRPDDFTNKGNRCPKCSGYLKKDSASFQLEVRSLVEDEYIVLSEYVNAQTKVEMKHIICNSKFQITPNNFLTGNRCPSCKNKRIGNSVRKSSEWFNNKVKSLTNEEYSVLEEYIDSKTEIEIRHNVCNKKYKTKPVNFLSGARCTHCFKNYKKSQNDIESEVLSLSDGDYQVVGEYINARSKIEVQHLSCNHKYYTYISTFQSGRGRCKYCRESGSKGEVRVKEFIVKHNLSFEPQKKFENCKNKRELPFDFYLNEGNVLIEYDGEQHFKSVSLFGGEKELLKTQSNDQIKNKYCVDNNIPLLRIPYWKYDEIEHILFDFLVKHGVIEEL